jgi:hypothetical protein
LSILESNLRDVLEHVQVVVVIFGRLAIAAPNDRTVLTRSRFGVRHILIGVRAILLVLQAFLVVDFVKLGLLILALPCRARKNSLFLRRLPEEVL